MAPIVLDMDVQCLIRWECCSHLERCGIVANSQQRIEAWWGILRKWNSDWWIQFFKVKHINILVCDNFVWQDLKENGDYDETDPVCV